jgi:hypothetical protein
MLWFLVIRSYLYTADDLMSNFFSFDQTFRFNFGPLGVLEEYPNGVFFMCTQILFA